MDLAIKIIFLVVFFAVMIGIGLITRKKANSVEGFVLGGRNAGPWLTAFGYGTSYFSAVVFIGYAGQGIPDDASDEQQRQHRRGLFIIGGNDNRR